MTCREVAEFLMTYIDGQLPAEQRAEFDRHLSVCTPCVSYLKSYETTVALGKNSADECDQPDAAQIPDDLVQAILSARNRK